jgi:hypothetical protein
MYIQNIQCSNPYCSHAHGVDAMKLALQASRWACPLCGTITDYAQQQAAQPGASMDAKQFWTIVGIGATVVGLIVAAQIVDQSLGRLTA